MPGDEAIAMLREERLTPLNPQAFPLFEEFTPQRNCW
jgi:hypothetical protein